jgi:predicted HAD superfamily Cof-like phosphohydrolase
MTQALRESEIPLVDAVDGFMRLAGQTVDKFNGQQAALYTGLCLEEMGEMIDVIIQGCLTEQQRQRLHGLSNVLHQFAKEFREGLHQGEITRCNHDELMDAQFDLSWVAIGALKSTSAFSDNAIAHGTFTNLDKFRDGKCVRDANGKVQKPADWQRPDFKPYIDYGPRV